MAYAVRGRSCDWLAPSIWHLDRSRAEFALTFDDGPSESTPRLLDLLDQHKVKATFFLVGQNVQRLPKVAREVHTRGHAIGNHTQSHPHLYFKSSPFIHDQLASAQRVIEDIVGISPRYFRAPYGVRWFGLAAAQRELGLQGVMWTTIGRDWNQPADRVAQILQRGAGNGAILCLHDGRTIEKNPDIGSTVEGLRKALPVLLDRAAPVLLPA